MGALFNNTGKGVTPSTQTTLSFPHTCSGADRTLTVKIFVVDFHTSDIVSVTYDGVPLAVIAGTASAATSYNIETIGYILPAPSVGTHDVVITANAPFVMLAISESWNNTSGNVRGVPVTDNELTSSYGGATPGGGSYQLYVNPGDVFSTFIAYNTNTVPSITLGYGPYVITNSEALSTTQGCASSNAIEPDNLTPVPSLAEYGWHGIGGNAFATFAFVIESGSQVAEPGGTIRSYPPGLLTSPYLCTAVLIQRADGITYGLTDATVPFTYLGQFYQTYQGADASTIKQTVGTGADNLEVVTILNDALSYVKSSDIIGTRYEDSMWTLFQIDYTNPANGAMILGVFRLSRAKLTDTDMGLQLMGLLSFLRQASGLTMTPNCSAVRVFGDKICDPSQTIRAAHSHSLTVGYVWNLSTVDFFGDTQAQFYYNFGDATWETGANTPLVTQIKIHTVISVAAYNGSHTYAQGDYASSSGSTYTSLVPGNTGHTPASSPLFWAVVTGNPTSVARIVWRAPYTFYAVAPGDTALLCFGCDRTRLTCSQVVNSHEANGFNIANFTGFYLPDPNLTLLVGR